MGMWIIITVELLAIPIGSIWMLFLREKSRRFKICSIFLIILVAIASSITTYLSFAKDPSLQNTFDGVLTPKYKTSYQQDDSSIHLLHWDTTSQKLTVQMKDNEIIQPFGRNVPFSVKKTKEGILISVKVKSIMDEHIVAEVRENKWLINQNNYFKKNFDEHALEVVGQDDVTYLQVEYLNATTLRIGGVFFTESANTSSAYPDFPSVPDNVEQGAILEWAGVIILGEGKLVALGKSSSQSEKEETRTIAKSSIKPWFDYSEYPKKIGIRKL
jgi:Ni,Fe-hydrogenase I large subunit